MKEHVQLQVIEMYCSPPNQFSVQAYCRMLMKEFIYVFSHYSRLKKQL